MGGEWAQQYRRRRKSGLEGPTRPRRTTFDMCRFEFVGLHSLEPRLLLDGSAPEFDADLTDQSLPADGSALTIVIDASDVDGDDPIISALSDDLNLRLFTTPVNRFASMSFFENDGFTPIGDLIFELFDTRFPDNVERLTVLATTGFDEDGNVDPNAEPFYTDLDVFRISPDFVIQSGDKVEGNGSGPSPLGNFEADIDPTLVGFSGAGGVLAWANRGSDPNTSDNQFFVTADVERDSEEFLTPNFAIIGQMVEGQVILDELLTRGVDGGILSDPPLIQSVTFLDGHNNGTLTLFAKEGFDGRATVTVDLDDGNGNVTQQSFDVFQVGDPPEISDLGRVDMQLGGDTTTVELTITDDLDSALDVDVMFDHEGATISREQSTTDATLHTLTITVPDEKLAFDVTVTAREMVGASELVETASQTFTVSTVGSDPEISGVEVPAVFYLTPGETDTFTFSITDDQDDELVVTLDADDQTVQVGVEMIADDKYQGTIVIPPDQHVHTQATITASEVDLASEPKSTETFLITTFGLRPTISVADSDEEGHDEEGHEGHDHDVHSDHEEDDHGAAHVAEEVVVEPGATTSFQVTIEDDTDVPLTIDINTEQEGVEVSIEPDAADPTLYTATLKAPEKNVKFDVEISAVETLIKDNEDVEPTVKAVEVSTIGQAPRIIGLPHRLELATGQSHTIDLEISDDLDAEMDVNASSDLVLGPGIDDIGSIVPLIGTPDAYELRIDLEPDLHYHTNMTITASEIGQSDRVSESFLISTLGDKPLIADTGPILNVATDDTTTFMPIITDDSGLPLDLEVKSNIDGIKAEIDDETHEVTITSIARRFRYFNLTLTAREAGFEFREPSTRVFEGMTGPAILNADDGRTATWTGQLPADGWYNVYAQWAIYKDNGSHSHFERDPEAVYRVTHANGTDSVAVNQNNKADERFRLGTFQFNAGPATVSVTGSGRGEDGVNADAISWEFLTTTFGLRPTISDEEGHDEEGHEGHDHDVHSDHEEDDHGAAHVAEMVDFDPDIFVDNSHIIVDNADDGFSTVGNWNTSSAVDQFGTDSVFSNQAGDSATWIPDSLDAASYDVYARWTGRKSDGTFYNHDTNAQYQIKHSGGTTSVFVDQNVDPGEWILLGTFEFAGDGTDQVDLAVSGVGSNGTSADAIRWEHVHVEEIPDVIVDNDDDGFVTQGEWEVSNAVDSFGPDSVTNKGSTTHTAVNVGDLLYVANGQAGIAVFDITDLTNAQRLGVFDTDGNARHIEVLETTAGTTAFVADGGNGFVVLDVNNPAHIVMLDHVDTVGHSVRHLLSRDEFLFVSEGSGGISTYDISDPRAITKLDRITKELTNAFWMIPNGDLMYVADLAKGIEIIDISVPANLRHVHSFADHVTPHGMSISGDRLYVVDPAHNDMRAYGLDRANRPNLLGKLTQIGPRPQRVATLGDIAVVGHESGFWFVDVSDPDRMKITRAFTPVFRGGHAVFLPNGFIGMPLLQSGQIIFVEKDLILPQSTQFTRKHTIVDDNGVKVTIRINGFGNGTIKTTRPEGGNIKSLIFGGTSPRTTINITTRGGETTINELIVSGFTKAINAKTTNIDGEVNINYTKKLTLNDVAGKVRINSFYFVDHKINVKFGEVNDLDLVSRAPVKMFSASSWTNTDQTDDFLEAPTFDRISVRENFEANLAAFGIKFIKRTMGRATFGSVRNSDIELIGDSGTLQVKNTIENTNIRARQVRAHNGDLKSISFGHARDTQVKVDGLLKSVSAKQWLGGRMEADEITRIKINGDRRLNAPGDLMANIQARLIGQMSVKGDLRQSQILLSEPVDPGRARQRANGSIKIAGSAVESEIRSAGNLKKLSMGGLTGTTIFAGINLSIQNGLPTNRGHFDALARINGLTVKGMTTDSNIAASELTNLRLGEIQTNNNRSQFGLSALSIDRLYPQLLQGGGAVDDFVILLV